MMTPNKKQWGLLTILLAVLAVTIVIGYRFNRSPDPVVVQAQGQKPVSPLPAQSGAKIRLDLLDQPKVEGDLGKSNLFQYRTTRPPESAAHPTGFQPPPAAFVPAPSRPTGPPPPPPPPPIPLKYVGFASVAPNSKALIATLLDDNQHPFIAREGDIWMGRYRVTRVTETAVDIEDLQVTRHQTLPITKQP